MIIKLFFTAAFLIASFSVSAKGPTGLGALKIGMSKEAVEALSSSDGVYLSAPMTPYEYKDSSPIPNENKFNVPIISTISSSPLEATLTFSENKLKAIYLDLETTSNTLLGSNMLEVVKGQISSKYGEPKVENSMKEEQCIYKNGANFKISVGVINYKWLLSQPKGEKVETSLTDAVYEICPSNLREPGLGPIKIKSLSIEVVNDKSDKKTANPF